MRVGQAIRFIQRNQARSFATRAALALLVLMVLSVPARADENHGDSAHNVSLSCPGTVNEGAAVTVTLTRGSDATKPIKGTVRTKPNFAREDDYHHISVTVNHSGDSKTVQINTKQDTDIEGDESFKVEWVNDHNDTSTLCQILILDDDDVAVESLEVTSTPESGDVYGLGETIEVTMTLDNEVDASNSAYVVIEVGGPNVSVGFSALSNYIRRAKYASGSGTNEIVYEYEVKRYDLDTNGLSIAKRDSNLGLPGLKYAGTSISVSIGGYSGQINLSDHKIDGLPRITDIEITSEPADGDAYRFRERIVFEMTLDAKVKVHGAPGLKFHLTEALPPGQAGNRLLFTEIPDTSTTQETTAAFVTRWATYNAALTREANGSSEGPTVIFVYDVGPTDEATGGIAVPENDIDDQSQFVPTGQSGGSVRFEVLHNVTESAQVRHHAHYVHDGLEVDSTQEVDGTDPLIEIEVGTVNNALGATLTFWNMPNDDGDLTWRADVKSDGEDQDSCEGANMGADNTIAEDDIPELGESIERTVNLASGCAAGTYRMKVTATVNGEGVASASTSFQINLSWSPGN